MLIALTTYPEPGNPDSCLTGQYCICFFGWFLVALGLSSIKVPVYSCMLGQKPVNHYYSRPLRIFNELTYSGLQKLV
jgi:hypothetical protein